ncbi:RING-H2 finger protein ATL46-like [Zingiber officinale]|uniref:RING-H2 finger protein ATL46-like n=1 Tax=Zingiber officinale TaxID=94328 RepID=UPI001C4C482C|nr:RING-H2 finger protein ATL46-like [Zingiber officinale]
MGVPWPAYTLSVLLCAEEELLTALSASMSLMPPIDELRLLPVYRHAFHLACIDMWLLSNSTCPFVVTPFFLRDLPMNTLHSIKNNRTKDDEEATGDPHISAVKETAIEKGFLVRSASSSTWEIDTEMVRAPPMATLASKL